MLTAGQAAAVRSMIMPFCSMDPYSARSPTRRYSITSLYLDTPHLGFFRQWELAAPRRFKLRVRRYGERVGDSPVFLETKIRIGDTTVKKRAVLEPRHWLETARDGGGKSALEQDFCARRDRYRCQPTLLVRYEREAWKGARDAYARVTFDAHLQYQPCALWSLDGDGPWLPVDDGVSAGEETPRVLLELKFERDVPRWMTTVMRSLELERRGFSKYGVGVQKAFSPALRLDAAAREPRVPDVF